MSSSDLRKTFAEHDQSQVFRYFDELSAAERKKLLAQAEAIDLAEIGRLYHTLVKGGGHATEVDAAGLRAAPFIPLPGNGGSAAKWAKAAAAGEAALRAGRVAAFTVAGGQGTRLGFPGPKGTFPVTPVRRASLFQVFAEKIKAAGARHGRTAPWFVMTSNINHADTVAYFKKHRFFGLDPARVRFFSQGLMPAVDGEGKILLEGNGAIALSPDGHGGSLRALVRSGAIAAMEAEGIDMISYFQVDNPLVRCLDPAFIGFHLLAGSEMSSKTLIKTDPKEKVGLFCRDAAGRDRVIEYSNPLIKTRLAEREPDGSLTFRAGSIGIHIFGRDFVKRLGGGAGDFALPFHPAHKKVPSLNRQGRLVKPRKPNGWKFEMFVFDALPFAKKPVIVETAREDDFSPVKNARKEDSPRSCREDQLRQFARWALAAGIDLPVDASGLPGRVFEIAPEFADSEAEFVAKWRALKVTSAIKAGIVIGA